MACLPYACAAACRLAAWLTHALTSMFWQLSLVHLALTCIVWQLVCLSSLCEAVVRLPLGAFSPGLACSGTLFACLGLRSILSAAAWHVLLLGSSSSACSLSCLLKRPGSMQCLAWLTLCCLLSARTLGICSVAIFAVSDASLVPASESCVFRAAWKHAVSSMAYLVLPP